MARGPYRPTPAVVPDVLRGLSPEAYAALRFDPEQALWRGRCLFQVQLFPLGAHYDRRVQVNTIDRGVATRVDSRPGMFDFGALEVAPEQAAELGFAGLRILFPLHRPGGQDELAVFLGASYFRLLGRNQQFGLSARGLAIDTASPKGEEFPYFREFRLEQPAPEADEVTVYALLDSKSVTGAYRFILYPGSETVAQVNSKLFTRLPIEKLGVAPLTSMFLYGESGRRRFDDYRPEVHDSDGLLIHTSAGEWLWRPLENPRSLRVSAFLDQRSRGFGLSQRDRAFASYQDLITAMNAGPAIGSIPRAIGAPDGSS